MLALSRWAGRLAEPRPSLYEHTELSIICQALDRNTRIPEQNQPLDPSTRPIEKSPKNRPKPAKYRYFAPKIDFSRFLRKYLMTHERWLPLPDYPQIEISVRGSARWADTHDPLKRFRWHGYICIRVSTAPRTLHNLVASLFLPDKPPDATHAFFLTPDRENCAASNLTWTKPDPRPIERRSGRPMSGQLIYALKARAKKGA